MKTSKQMLKAAGILTFAVAVFQAVVTSVPEWARYFGAWEAVASKLWLLYLSGFFVAIIFAVFGFYALSGIGIVKRLPLLRTGLIFISFLFILRGLFLILEIMINTGAIQSKGVIPTRELVSSAVSLIIGILYLTGVIGCWSAIPVKERQTIGQ